MIAWVISDLRDLKFFENIFFPLPLKLFDVYDIDLNTHYTKMIHNILISKNDKYFVS